MKAASKSTSVESMSTSTTPAEGRELPMDVSPEAPATEPIAWERGTAAAAAVAAAAGTGVVGMNPEEVLEADPALAAGEEAAADTGRAGGAEPPDAECAAQDGVAMLAGAAGPAAGAGRWASAMGAIACVPIGGVGIGPETGLGMAAEAPELAGLATGRLAAGGTDVPLGARPAAIAASSGTAMELPDLDRAKRASGGITRTGAPWTSVANGWLTSDGGSGEDRPAAARRLCRRAAEPEAQDPCRTDVMRLRADAESAVPPALKSDAASESSPRAAAAAACSASSSSESPPARREERDPKEAAERTEPAKEGVNSGEGEVPSHTERAGVPGPRASSSGVEPYTERRPGAGSAADASVAAALPVAAAATEEALSMATALLVGPVRSSLAGATARASMIPRYSLVMALKLNWRSTRSRPRRPIAARRAGSR
mmetsp:Transcript_25845/g.97331  ORF Transcript_25845/g.97331 Transcript_25845/m.97331 type:complete len:429 (+) Transcript_25845:781-2067(+)